MTIHDQATELRRLVLQAARQDRARQGPAPRLVIVTGGGAGVGSTTLSINLAVAFGDLGLRAVLVDAAEDACVAERCGLNPAATISDILAARRDIHEVLIRGPSGVQVAPGEPSTRHRGHSAAHRLVGQLKTLGPHADLVLVDAGDGVGEISDILWMAADEVLLTTTTDNHAIMDAYSVVKKLRDVADNTSIQLVVNQEDDEAIARDLCSRIELSCERFLKVTAGWGCFIPRDARFAACDEGRQPLISRHPEAAAARAMSEFAQRLSIRRGPERRDSREPMERRAA